MTRCEVHPRTGSQDDSLRILRRGITWGPALPENSDEVGSEVKRGLFFNGFVANLEEQFERLYKAANESEPQGPDPLLGTAGYPDSYQLPQVGVTRPRAFTLEKFVRILGVVYAFAPSLSVLRTLAAGGRQRS